MGRPSGMMTTISRSVLIPAGALAALELVVAEERRGILEPEDSVPTLGVSASGWSSGSTRDGTRR